MKHFLILCSVLFLLSATKASGQDIITEEVPCNKQKTNASCDGGWTTLGLIGESDERLGIRIGANIGRSKFWKIAFQSSSTLFGGNQRTSLSFLRGYSLVDRIGRAAFSAGPSIYRYEENTGFGIKRKFTPGLTLSAEIGVTPIKTFGGSLEFFTNISPDFFTFGAGVSFLIEGHK